MSMTEMPLTGPSHRFKPPNLETRFWEKMKQSYDGDPRQQIHACVRDNDMYLLRELLPLCKTGELDVNYAGCGEGSFGTALTVAVLYNNMIAVELLLNCGAEPWANYNSWTEPVESPIGAAIETGNHEMFLCLCRPFIPSKKMPPNPLSTLFAYTTSQGQTAMVKDVLAWMGNSLTNDQSNSAVDTAVSRGHVGVTELLFSRCSPSAAHMTKWLCRATRLDAAGWREYTNLDYANIQLLIKFLIQSGADPNTNVRRSNLVIEVALQPEHVAILKALLEDGARPDNTGSHHETALHHLGSPVICGKSKQRCLHETGIRLLLQYGASVTVTDEFGNTPLHYAAFGSNLYIFSLYAAKLTDQTLIEGMKNEAGEMLLHWAAAGKKIDTLLHLLALGPENINTLNQNGWTPLMCALAPSAVTPMGRKPCCRKALLAAKILLDHGADSLTRTDEGWTPLHCLALYAEDVGGETTGIADFAQELIAKGSPVNAKALLCHSPSNYGLHPSSRSNLYVGTWGSRVAQCLQKTNGEGDPLYKEINTPLHWALHYGALDLARVLLANGALTEGLTEGLSNGIIMTAGLPEGTYVQIGEVLRSIRKETANVEEKSSKRQNSTE